MKNQVIFISGIDTGIGKTYLTGLLAKALHDKGKKIITQKLVQTGSKSPAEDILIHRKLMNYPLLNEDKQGITCPYIFKYPASPHLSAALENQSIEPEKINQCTTQLLANYEMVLLEGAGGLMVPLTEDYLTINYIKKFDIPLILVTTPKLGSINQTLLNLHICKQYHLRMLAIVYNSYHCDDLMIKINTKKILEHHLEKIFPSAFFLEMTSEALENQALWKNFINYLLT